METIFHEFGHLLHLGLSQTSVRSQGGTNVAWDFVELPSQIMENWCWEREALNLFARHYQTGETIPEELFQKMRRARTFRGANMQMRQLSFGIVDLKLHRDYSPERDGDVIDYSRNILQQFSAAKLPPDHASIASFTHLFSSPVGYGAGYYSYKWAEVLDADAFGASASTASSAGKSGLAFRKQYSVQGRQRRLPRSPTAVNCGTRSRSEGFARALRPRVTSGNVSGLPRNRLRRAATRRRGGVMVLVMENG